MKKKVLFLLLPLALPLCAAPANADKIVKQLAPGVTLTQEIDQKTPLVINILDVDLRERSVHVNVGIGQDQVSGADATHGREDVSRYARRHNALAAVNGDFFPYTGDPLGLAIKGGELVSEPYIKPRAAMGLTADGKSASFAVLGYLGDLQAQDGQRVALNGVDRVAKPNEIVAYTAMYGAVTGAPAGSTEVIVTKANLPVRANKLMEGEVQQVITGTAAPAAIPADGFVLSGAPGSGAAFLAAHVHAGERIGFAMGVAPVDSVNAAVQIANLPRGRSDIPSRAGAAINRLAYFWANVPEAIGGGPLLLLNGQVAVDGAAEGFNAGFTDQTNPRTAVGTTKDGGHLLIVTVDGRQSISKGVTLPDLAAILKRYGAWNAMNLDGGGSTCMAVGGLIVNSPSGVGYERPVADMLVVDSDQPEFKMPDASDPPADAATLVLPTAPIFVGDAAPLTIRAGGLTIAGADPRILWQGMVTGGVGFINQKGCLISLKAGTGTISALFKGQLVTGVVTVQSKGVVAPVYTLHASLAADPSGAPNRGQLTVRVLDQNGMPLPKSVVTLTGHGATPDAKQLTIDMDGQATTGVTWDGAAGGTITVQSGTMTPVAVSQPHQ